MLYPLTRVVWTYFECYEMAVKEEWSDADL